MKLKKTLAVSEPFRPRPKHQEWAGVTLTRRSMYLDAIQDGGTAIALPLKSSQETSSFEPRSS
jgi:hypothetical protein